MMAIQAGMHPSFKFYLRTLPGPKDVSNFFITLTIYVTREEERDHKFFCAPFFLFIIRGLPPSNRIEKIGNEFA